MKLLKFEQNNCTPCKMLENFMTHELNVHADMVVNITAGTVTDHATGEVVADESAVMEMAGEFGIMKTPTLILMDDNGSEISRFAGVGQTGVREILAERGLI